MTPMLHYVCDHCGNYWQAYRATDCPACKAKRIWEFGTSVNAKTHAAQIQQRTSRATKVRA